MKKSLALLLCLLLLVPAVAFAKADTSVLSYLNSTELKTLQEDIEQALGLYHEPHYDEEESVLKATKEKVEAHFKKQGIDISWAWVNYDYTKDWDFFTLKTHIDYKDSRGKQKSDVYSEVFVADNEYVVYYLSVGNEILINRRAELPNTKWASMPPPFINKNTGFDLSHLTSNELKSLNKSTQEEFTTNHEPNSKIKELLLSLTEVSVEKYFDEKEIEVSWSWFDYTYTRDWDLYTLTTPIEYFNNNKFYDEIVYAEAYPFSNQYALCYLTVGEHILIDIRDQIPEDAFPKKDESISIAPINTLEPTPTPEPTATPVPILLQKGSKGEDVRQIQEYLILLGYLDGSADGDFGNKTKAAVEAFQEAFSLDVTGIIDNDDMDMLLTAMDGLEKILAEYEAQRQKWIDSQFSWWDGSHDDLEELIKDALNDESSYKHIETSYIDISDNDRKTLINETLRSLGNSNRVEIGDLFIIVEFSAKNAFNGTVKNTAYGIASYEDNTISLVAIE